MPTPFMHLEAAARIRDHGLLGEEGRRLIMAHYPAFYFGNVAPDFQWICDLPRESTHFYELPPKANEKATARMFSSYPILTNVAAMPDDQIVFVVGYCAHLLIDLRWYHDVLVPYFIETTGWDDNYQRFVAHNTLLTYLDRIAISELPDNAWVILASAEPRNWLPFANDTDLVQWQDMLVEQLKPGAPLQTVEIYAERLSMSPAEYSARLEESDWMNKHLFSRVPVDSIQEILVDSVRESATFITTYLATKEGAGDREI